MYPKLIYLLISIILLTSSCNSDPGDDIRYSTGTELTFNVSNPTRSSVTTSIDKFVVYGDMKPAASDGSSSPIVIFDKKNVEYKNGAWYYDGLQYWMPDHEHSFVAVAPESILGSGNNVRYLNSHLSFEYSIPTSGNVDDILIATHRRLYGNNGYGPSSDSRITLTFSHLLSLINIAPAFSDNSIGSEEYILFHKLEFSGIRNRAKVDILPASRQTGSSTNDMDVDITGQEVGDYTIVFPTPVKVKNNAENVKLFADDDAIIMLPQAFTADAELTLSYTINEDNTINYVSIPLKNQKCESGRSYTYKFTIERFGVILDSCEINPWNVITGDEITVD